MQDGVIPTVQESQRIAASVRAFERSTSARITSRPQRPRKKVRFSSGGGPSPETTGTCPCVKGTGVVEPTVSDKFGTILQCFRWLVPQIVAALNNVAGFSITTTPNLEWNTDDPVNLWITDDIVRTCDAYTADTYVITWKEDATLGIIAHVGILGRDDPEFAGVNCDDEVDWTFVSAHPDSPYSDRTNQLRLYGPSTKTSRDGAYVDPPSVCVFCLEPASSLLSQMCSPSIQVPMLHKLTISNVRWSSAPADYILMKLPSGTPHYIASVDLLQFVEDHIAGVHLLDMRDATETLAGSVVTKRVLQKFSGGPTYAMTAYENSDGSGATYSETWNSGATSGYIEDKMECGSPSEYSLVLKTAFSYSDAAGVGGTPAAYLALSINNLINETVTDSPTSIDFSETGVAGSVLYLKTSDTWPIPSFIPILVDTNLTSV